MDELSPSAQPMERKRYNQRAHAPIIVNEHCVFLGSMSKHADDIEAAAAPLGLLHGMPVSIQINDADP
ncbi:hypothetical protein AiwAL_04945 [Acidiphilium sp. AL]|nr:hypothetical protein [Acidiphilium sp. AL]